MRWGLQWKRSSWVARAPDCQCKRCHSPGFHFVSSDTVESGWGRGVAYVALFHKVNKKHLAEKKKKDHADVWWEADLSDANLILKIFCLCFRAYLPAIPTRGSNCALLWRSEDDPACSRRPWGDPVTSPRRSDGPATLLLPLRRMST